MASNKYETGLVVDRRRLAFGFCYDSILQENESPNGNAMFGLLLFVLLGKGVSE
jgi:hypothetical protein